MAKTWWSGLRGAALGAALLCAGTAGAGERLQLAVGDSATLGPATAPVTVFEFVDYQ